MVVDTNFLRTDALHTFLTRSRRNSAVLCDYVAMEAYKGDALIAVSKSMRVLEQFPTQVVILKSTATLVRQRGRVSGLAARMIDEEQTGGFASFCIDLRAAEAGDPVLMLAIERLQAAARIHFDQLLADAQTTADVFSELSANFTASEILILRDRGAPVPASLIDKLILLAMNLAAHAFQGHPAGLRLPRTAAETFNTFVFRYALSMTLLYVNWLEGGGQKNRAAAKARNDMVDMNIATCGAFFDGVLRDDRKLVEIHSQVRTVLSRLGAYITH